jgi:hypothetical protein
VAALLACLLLLLLPRLLSPFVRRRTRSLPYPANRHMTNNTHMHCLAIHRLVLKMLHGL